MKKRFHIETTNNGSVEYLMSFDNVTKACEWSFDREDAFEYNDVDEATIEFEEISDLLNAVQLHLCTSFVVTKEGLLTTKITAETATWNARNADIVGTIARASFIVEGKLLTVSMHISGQWRWWIGLTSDPLASNGFYPDIYAAIEAGKEWIAHAK